MGRIANLKPVEEFRCRLERDLTIERIILFGSRARGTESADSDWDVVIVSPDFAKQRFRERMRRLYKYWDYQRYGAFEPLPYTLEEFTRLSKEPTIVREALREGYTIS